MKFKVFIRRNLFSRLDRYIMAKFLGTYFFSILLIISIAVVFDFSENSDKFTMNHAPAMGLLGYYLNFIPFYSNLFSALFVFIAVITQYRNNILPVSRIFVTQETDGLVHHHLCLSHRNHGESANAKVGLVRG